jgi:hypothetical protein
LQQIGSAVGAIQASHARMPATRLRSRSNIWVAIRKFGKRGCELSVADFGMVSGEFCVVTAGARSVGAEFGQNWCRLELGAVVCFLEVTDDSNCNLCRLEMAGRTDTRWRWLILARRGERGVVARVVEARVALTMYPPCGAEISARLMIAQWLR